MAESNSKPRICVWGFTSVSMAPVIEAVKSQGLADVPVWIGNGKHGNLRRSDFMDMTQFPLRCGTICDPAVYDRVYANMFKYLEMTNRYNNYNRHTIYELLNGFNLQINYFYELLKKEKIDLVLLSRIPHYGPDLLLYETARAMGIRTMMLYQSIFPERFLFTFSIEDFGHFDQIPEVEAYEPITVEKKFEKELWYMKNVVPYRYSFSDAWRDFRGKWGINAFWRWQQAKQYRKDMEAIVDFNLDLDRKFVYFPLQLQPELTTTALGDEYFDQVLAIERLSALLPEDWMIYVKENPKQTEYQRDRLFFERLKRLPKVRVTPLEMNTYVLIKHSQFIATVTGTVTWEAISGGKKALVFGRPTYLGLPGVIHYRPDLTLDEILRSDFTHEELEAGLSRRYTKMPIGVVDEKYGEVLPNFTIEDNCRKLVRFIEKILNHLETESTGPAVSSGHQRPL